MCSLLKPVFLCLTDLYVSAENARQQSQLSLTMGMIVGEVNKKLLPMVGIEPGFLAL